MARAKQDSPDALRERLIVASLAHIPFDGWTQTALLAGAKDIDVSPALALNAFPGGARELAEAFSDHFDRLMLESLEAANLEDMRVRDRIALGVRRRLELLAEHREAVRRLLAFLALPQNAALGMKCLYRSVDAIWYAAGDRATDYNFYSKRMLLAGVTSTTTLCWLNDKSDGFAETWDFLERRIDEVMKLGGRFVKLMNRCSGVPERLVRRGLAARSKMRPRGRRARA